MRIVILFLIFTNCVLNYTSPSKDDSRNNCAISSLLYVDKNGRLYKDETMGLLALLSCDRYLNWDPYE